MCSGFNHLGLSRCDDFTWMHPNLQPFRWESQHQNPAEQVSPCSDEIRLSQQPGWLHSPQAFVSLGTPDAARQMWFKGRFTTTFGWCFTMPPGLEDWPFWWPMMFPPIHWLWGWRNLGVDQQLCNFNHAERLRHVGNGHLLQGQRCLACLIACSKPAGHSHRVHYMSLRRSRRPWPRPNQGQCVCKSFCV